MIRKENNKYFRSKSVFLLLFFVHAFSLVYSQLSPAPRQKEHIIIMNATAHLGDGNIIENSVVAFENGKITLVGDARLVKLDMGIYTKVIDGNGKHIYPG